MGEPAASAVSPRRRRAHPRRGAPPARAAPAAVGRAGQGRTGRAGLANTPARHGAFSAGRQPDATLSTRTVFRSAARGTALRFPPSSHLLFPPPLRLWFPPPLRGRV